MELTTRQLKQTASRRLSEASFSPGKLALLHSLALVLVLVLDVVQYLLQLQIENTGGLSGMDMRAIMTTIQSLLSILWVLLLPFWRVAFYGCALKMARGAEAEPRSLTLGFRRFGPVLRFFLLETGLYVMLALLAGQISSILFVMTPLSNGMFEAMEKLPDTQVIDETVLEALMPHTYTLYILLAIAMAILLIPLFYKLRFARFAVMEEQSMGAMAALRLSAGMTYKRRLWLLRLDLSFWWYYLLLLLCGVLTDGGFYLQLLNVELPLPSFWTNLLLRAVGIGLQVLISWRYLSYVQTTYAVAYNSILHPTEE